MYFYVYYIKESLFKQNNISVVINLAVDCKAIIFACEITINNFTCAIISVLSVPEIPIKHNTLYNK